jgi:hypothetical protein
MEDQGSFLAYAMLERNRSTKRIIIENEKYPTQERLCHRHLAARVPLLACLAVPKCNKHQSGF